MNEMIEIGTVIGTTTLRGFRFVIKDGLEDHVKRDEFVIVKESVTGKDILGVIKEISTSNELFPEEFGRDLRFNNIVITDGVYPVATVKVFGCEEKSGITLPRHGITPGSKVYLASDEILDKILRLDEKTSAFIGTLATRESIKVYVSINEMISKHVAVLAMTGSGKSYTVGVLIEELLKKKGSVVVFDPHGEYKNIKMDGVTTTVYKIRDIRDSAKEEDAKEEKIKISVPSLTATDFSNLIPDLTDPQRDLLDEVLDSISKIYEKYDLEIIGNILSRLYNTKTKKDETELPQEVAEIAKKVSLSTIGALMRRIKRLEKINIFFSEGTRIEDIAKKRNLTVIDISDVDERVSEIIVTATCREIFEARKRNSESKIPPTFLIIEEAHNFAPKNVDRVIPSLMILRKIAREGRKFGVGLCIVSQRPNKLDSDILSQCNTQIIMKIVNPSDQNYIRESVESVTEDIVRDLPSLSRGEAIISGTAVRLPVTVKIRTRETQVLGKDVDFVGIWNE